MPRPSPAEKRLAEANKAVEDARHRLAEVRGEQRRVAGEHDQTEAAIRQAQYDAAAVGRRANVAQERTAAAKLQQELEDLAPVEQAIADGVAAAERERDRLIRECFPELSDALERRAAQLVEAANALAEKHARQRVTQAAAERELEDEWRRLMVALPQPFRGRFDRSSLTVDPSPLTPDPGLSVYVDGSWAPWMRAVHEQSQELAQEQRDRATINMPMGA
jgi:predicted  nucleic acid-binding Zn-ribbon protein